MGRRGGRGRARAAAPSMRVGRTDDAGFTLLRSHVGRAAGADSVMDVGVKDGEQVTLMKRMGTWAFVRSASGDADIEGWLLHDYLHEIESAEQAADTPEQPAPETEIVKDPVDSAKEEHEAEDVNTPAKAGDAESPRNSAGDAADDAADEDGETRYVKGPGLDSVQGKWAQLVIRCARALKRSAKNLPVYVSEGAIKLQLAVLGDEAVGKILALGEAAAGRELTDDEGKYVVQTLAKGIKHSSLTSQNGAKAALNAVKYIAGASKVAGSSGGARKSKKPKGPTVSMSCSAGAAAAAEGAAANLSAKFLENVSAADDDAGDADMAIDPADEPALGWLTGKTITRPPRTARADEKWDIDEPIEKPSFDDIHVALDSVTIPVNLTRLNVKQSKDQEVTGMCLGVVNARSNGVVASSFGRNRPNLTKTLVNFAKLAVPDFNFTSIQVNKNYLSAMHVDKNNLGPSYIVGVGDYTEGGLWVQTLGAVDCNRKWILFDGNVPHCTLPYTGTRYTLIYFAQQSFARLGAMRPHGDDKQWMAQTGFPMPPKNARKLEYEPAGLRLKNAKAAFRKWRDCVEKGIEFDWNDQEVKTWERPEDDVHLEQRSPKRGAGRSKFSADLWSDSDSEEEVDDEIGTGWTWFVKGRGHLPFAGKPVPTKFVKKLGRTGGGRQLASNLLRQQLGLVPTLRQRKRVRRYMDEHTDDDMDECSDDDDGTAAEDTGRRKKRGRRRGTRSNETPSWMEGVVANDERGHAAKEDETPAEIAETLNVDVRQVVHLSKAWYPSLHARCKLLAGTVLLIPDTPGALPGNHVFPVEELPEEDNVDEDEPVGTWYRRRVVDKHTPQLSRSELRQLAVSAGVVSFKWANRALKLSERRRAAAALKREKKLISLEPTLVTYYNGLPATGPGGNGPQMVSFYSRKALAKRKGVPMSSLKPAKRAKLKKNTKGNKVKKDGPARPTNAYILFLKSARAEIAASNPDAGHGGITKICGAKWKLLSPEERAPFEEEAAIDRLRYAREMEQWRRDNPVKTEEPLDAASTGPELPQFEQTPPEGWTIELDEKRDEYFFWHEESQTSSWTHPVTGKFPDGSEPVCSDDAEDDTDAAAEEQPVSMDIAESAAAAPSPAPPTTVLT